MGIPVMILGASGSGKSASMRNFSPDEVGVLNVASKPLPFRSKLPVINAADYAAIYNALNAQRLADPKNAKRRSFVIDDSQYLMCFEMFRRAKETGYQKFTDCALNFYNLVQHCICALPPDVIVYFLHHVDVDDNGRSKAKTAGKMLDNQLTLEGLFSIVLMAYTDGKKHKFITQSDGLTTCKSPMEMFPAEIDNDLKYVDDTIREYYGFTNGGNET